MCYCWLSFSPKYFCVEVAEATSYRVTHADHGVVVECSLLQVVVKGAQWVIVSDEQHLCHRARPFDVSSNVTYRRKIRCDKDILVRLAKVIASVLCY